MAEGKSMSDRALEALQQFGEMIDYGRNHVASKVLGGIEEGGDPRSYAAQADAGDRYTEFRDLKDAVGKRFFGNEHPRFGVDDDGKTSIGDVADVGVDFLGDSMTDPMSALAALKLAGVFPKASKVLHAGEVGAAGTEKGIEAAKAAKAIEAKLIDLKGNVIEASVPKVRKGKKAVKETVKDVAKDVAAPDLDFDPYNEGRYDFPAEEVSVVKNLKKPSVEVLDEGLRMPSGVKDVTPAARRGIALDGNSIADRIEAIEKFGGKGAGDEYAKRLEQSLDWAKGDIPKETGFQLRPGVGEQVHGRLNKGNLPAIVSRALKVVDQPEAVREMIQAVPSGPGMGKKLLNLLASHPIQTAAYGGAGGLGITGLGFQMATPKTDGYRTQSRGPVPRQYSPEMKAMSEKMQKLVERLERGN